MRKEQAVLFSIACLMLAGANPIGANAQDYPNQPIKVIVPNPPGGPGDIISRAFTEKAAPTLGRPFVMEYRAGASTTIGTASAAKADPDGYTILALPSSGLERSLLRSSSDTTSKLTSSPSRASEPCRWWSLSGQG